MRGRVRKICGVLRFVKELRFIFGFLILVDELR